MRAAAVAATTVAAALAASAPAGAQTPGEGLCGGESSLPSVDLVPLDHGDPGGETIVLRTAMCRANDTSRGTIVVLPGGPGEGSALDAALGPLNDDYDMVFLTPRAAQLRCPSAPDGRFPAEGGGNAVERCAQELGARRSLYTTYQTVHDVEIVRRQLGVDRIILLGISYGGKVAGEYARRFPGNVQAMILDSSAPLEALDTMSELPRLAVERVLREVCFPPGCEQAFGRSPSELLRGAFASARQEGFFEPATGRPLVGSVVTGGRRERVEVTQADIHALVLASDVDALVRAELPAALDAAARRDAAPALRLMRHVAAREAAPSTLNEVGLLATSCVEGRFPWDPASPDPETGRPRFVLIVAAATTERYAPFPAEAATENLPGRRCVRWPATPRPPFPPSPERGPDVPVLVLAGREDLRTPLEDQRRTAAQYPDATVVPVPRVGHSVLLSDGSGCASRAALRFLSGRRQVRCPLGRRDFDIALRTYRSLRSVPLAQGIAPARVSRTATAVDLTLRDAYRWGFSTRRPGVLPGLRGGRIVIAGRSVRMERYEVVPGVRVSGRISGDAPPTLTVTGRGASGRLTLLSTPFGSRLVGRLGGVRIAYRPYLVADG